MALFGERRDVDLILSINRELLQKIIQQKVGYYKIDLEETVSNIYGESSNKFYHQPILIDCLISLEGQVTKNQNGLPTVTRKTTFSFLRDMLKTAGLVPERGDVVLHNENYYVVDNIIDNQYFLGKYPEYSYSNDTDNFGESVSLVLEATLTSAEKLNLKRERL